jgi:hypothetical protein
MANKLRLEHGRRRIGDVRRCLNASMFTLTLILAVGVAGCGGSSQDRLSKDDTTVIADALDGAVQVVQTAAPVLACDAATCNRAALERGCA